MASKKIEWNNDKVLEFIERYEAQPILWDPDDPNYKRKLSHFEAWEKIKNKLSWYVTVEELKKKRESLMAYYRAHINKYKKSINSGEEVYKTNWFAFSAMNSFLGRIYECNPLFVQIDVEGGEYQEGSDSEINEDENSFNLSSGIKEIKQEDFAPSSSGGRKRSRYDLESEVKSRYQINPIYEDRVSVNDEEYDTFGKLIASKLKKIKNPNTRDTLMNDMYNLVYRVSMKDRLEQQSLGPEILNETVQSSNASTSQSPHSQTK